MKKRRKSNKIRLRIIMSELGIKIIINIIVGIIVFVGFFAFWGRSAGWFKKGGLVYEYLAEKKAARKKAKQLKKQVSNEENKDNPINNK